jgi:hypothetical protein
LTEKKDASTEIFKHIAKTHGDLAKPSSHMKRTSEMGWGMRLDKIDPSKEEDKAKFTDEQLQSLSIMKPYERELMALELTIAPATNDYYMQNYLENRMRTSIAVKGQGRKDSKDIIGSVKQSISIPTSILQRIKNVRSGNRGNEGGETDSDYSS